MRVTKPITGGHSFLSTRHYVNILTYKLTIFTTHHFTRILLLTPISTWHYNYNRTPLSTRVLLCLKPGNRKEVAAPPLERVKSESKGSIKYRPVRIKLASPQPSLSAKQSRMLMMPTTSTSPSRSKSTQDKADSRVNLEDKSR